MAAEGDERLAFAGPAWIDAARGILEDLAAAHGQAGLRFSVCERFTDAPAQVAPSGVASWHFRIDGTSVTVAAGEIADADVNIAADYQKTLPVARLVYTPEFLEKRAAERAAGKGPAAPAGMSGAPAWLVELHNRLAVLTA
jgi:hypothetical protein